MRLLCELGSVTTVFLLVPINPVFGRVPVYGFFFPPPLLPLPLPFGLLRFLLPELFFASCPEVTLT